MDYKLYYVLMVGPDTELLEQNLAHARSLGVDEILLTVHNQNLAPIEKIADQYSASIVDVHHGTDIDAVERYARTVSQNCEASDWVIVADLDEFYEFPKPVREIIEVCNENGYDYVQGEFLDRLGANGTLPELQNGTLWDQYPVGAQITKAICLGNFRKITLLRAWVELGPGHHSANTGNACPKDRVFTRVHHFKWDASFYERADARIRMLKSVGRGYWQEYERAVAHLNANNQSFDLNDSTLEAYWPSFKRARKRISPQVHRARIAYNEDVSLVVPKNQPGHSITVFDEGAGAEIKNNVTGANIILNDTARHLVELIDGSRTVQNICDLLIKVYPNMRHEIEYDTQHTFRKLINFGAIEA